MKKFIKIILLMGISLLLLIGCSSNDERKTIDTFINKVVSAKTYEDITFGDDVYKSTDESKEVFGEYLTEDGFGLLMANRVPSIYYKVISANNITDTTDIKITKTKETETDTYVTYEYEVSYKLNSNEKSMDMTDYMVFKVMKDNTSIIDEVYVLDKTSSIFSEYKAISE